jgi:hypothetical protein
MEGRYCSIAVITIAVGALVACGGNTATASGTSRHPSTHKSAPAAVASPSPAPAASCSPGPDLIVRTVAPGAQPTAQAMGSYRTGNGCQPTVDLLRQTSPTGPGYCTTVALASDNPGYEEQYIYAPSPPPAPPLQHVILAIGGGC